MSDCRCDFCRQPTTVDDAELLVRCESCSGAKHRTPREVRRKLDKIELRQVAWEGSGSVMTFNGKPIGMTFRNAEIDRWWGDLKSHLAEYLTDCQPEGEDGDE